MPRYQRRRLTIMVNYDSSTPLEDERTALAVTLNTGRIDLAELKRMLLLPPSAVMAFDVTEAPRPAVQPAPAPAPNPNAGLTDALATGLTLT